VGAAAGAAAGNSSADTVQGGMAADGAVTNNFVHRLRTLAARASMLYLIQISLFPEALWDKKPSMVQVRVS